MRRVVVTVLSFALAVPIAAFATRHARPTPSQAPALRTLHFPADVATTELHDMARASAFQPAPGLHFEIDGAPAVTPQSIRLQGYLVNADAVAHEVIVFPAAAGGFYVGFVPNRGVSPRPPPPGQPPMPPPVPPPPMRFEIPARTRIAFESTLDPRGYVYAPGSSADLEWRFYYWNPPQPAGQFHVVMP